MATKKSNAGKNIGSFELDTLLSKYLTVVLKLTNTPPFPSSCTMTRTWRSAPAPALIGDPECLPRVCEAGEITIVGG